jgi:uncharacterized protein (TIGR04551 family)
MRQLVGSMAVVLAISLWAPEAQTQGFGASPRPGPSMKQEDTKTGPAEAAPEDANALEPELPPLPEWPGEKRKKLQFFEMSGYLRFRADMQHNHNLGQFNLGKTRAPFWVPISENDNSDNQCSIRRTRPVVGTGDDRGISEDSCPAKTLSGANMRLRLEPTINVAETVRIHSQLDIFDNLVLGSTPDSLRADGVVPFAPVSMLSTNQEPPIVGYNSNTPAIVVKRAWAEVDTPVGEIAFGRMAWNWGVGLLANDGSCWDCNFGNNQDRIRFESKPIFKHIFGVGYDFSSSGPHTMSVSDSNGRYHGGQAIDLEQLDDVDQLFAFAGRLDRPEVIEEKLLRGGIVFNYGAYFLWRRQDFDYAVTDESTLNASQDDLAQRLVERHGWFVTPDIWAKLMWRKLTVEFEGVLIGGKIENVSNDVDTVESRSLLQYGFVFRSRYMMLDDQLRFGLEVGMASGDESEMYDLNRRRDMMVDPTIIDTKLNEFRFNYDYLVDLILFRELLGTVANATYFKPWVQFEWLETLGAKLDFIYSLTHQKVAFPGNSHNLGLELDLDLYYQNVEDGFYAGVQYGVLFPFGALDRPESIYGSDAKNAEVAQTLQARLIVKF